MVYYISADQTSLLKIQGGKFTLVYVLYKEIACVMTEIRKTDADRLILK